MPEEHTLNVGLFETPPNPDTNTSPRFIFGLVPHQANVDKKAVYETQLDGGGWVVYDGPDPNPGDDIGRNVVYENLAVGPHIFEVRCSLDGRIGQVTNHQWEIVAA